MLAELIERCTGGDFRDFVEHRVCDPLGLPLLFGIPEEEQGDIHAGVKIGEAVETNPVNVSTEESSPIWAPCGPPASPAAARS